MILILPNTKSSKLMNFHASYPTSRIGGRMTLLLIIKSVTIKTSHLFLAELNVIFLMITAALYVKLLFNICLGMTVKRKARSDVKFVSICILPQKITVSPKLTNSTVLTVLGYWFRRKTASTSLSINASTLNVLTTSTILKE